MTSPRIDIILPAYREEGNIEKALTGIKKYVKTPHLVTVVLQDKQDPTIDSVKTIQKTTKNIQMIFTTNGKGMLKALKKGLVATKNPIIVIMMADLSDDPKDIDKMIAKIDKGYDLVCASRYIRKGKRIGGPKMKGLLSYFAGVSLNKLTGIPTSDATNAFKCFRRSVIEQIIIQSTEGFEMPLELTIKAFNKGFKITEVPTVWRDREKGKSKFDFWKNIPLYLRWYIYGILHK